MSGRRRPSRKGERLIEFVNGRVVVFIMRRVLKKSGQRGKPIRRDVESPIHVQQKQSAFHLRAQQNALRRTDARQQRRLLVRWNPREPTKLQSQQFIATLRPRERYRCTDLELTWCAGGMFWGRLRTKPSPMTITSSRNGGVGLTGNRGRKTADSSDVSASEINRKTAAHFMCCSVIPIKHAMAS